MSQHPDWGNVGADGDAQQGCVRVGMAEGRDEEPPNVGSNCLMFCNDGAFPLILGLHHHHLPQCFVYKTSMPREKSNAPFRHVHECGGTGRLPTTEETQKHRGEQKWRARTEGDRGIRRGNGWQRRTGEANKNTGGIVGKAEHKARREFRGE